MNDQDRRKLEAVEDLLEAAAALIQYFEPLELSEVVGLRPKLRERVLKVKAAIAKAEGR